MASIEPCPRCKQLPADCECDVSTSDRPWASFKSRRWIPLSKFGLSLYVDDGQHLMVYVPFGVPAERLREAVPTIMAWRDRVSRPSSHDLLERVRVARSDGWKPDKIAAWLNRRLRRYAQRHVEESKPAWSEAAVAELQQIGYSEDQASQIMKRGVAAERKGEQFFTPGHPIDSQRLADPIFQQRRAGRKSNK